MTTNRTVEADIFKPPESLDTRIINHAAGVGVIHVWCLDWGRVPSRVDDNTGKVRECNSDRAALKIPNICGCHLNNVPDCVSDFDL